VRKLEEEEEFSEEDLKIIFERLKKGKEIQKRLRKEKEKKAAERKAPPQNPHPCFTKTRRLHRILGQKYKIKSF
jgi:hypothetical protein